MKGTSPVQREKSQISELSASSVYSICRKPATQLVDGEPNCAEHIGQIYEHQVEDYARAHLSDWRK
jgi:hypothetical protein